MKKSGVKRETRRKPPARFNENPDWTREDFRRARPAAKVIPQIVEAKRGRGRPKVPNPKIPVTLRLDPGVVDAFRATGPGWQKRINEALERAVKRL
ncbi:MAG TPA: BrnA antitoxin family protein [Rhizomicrobium sp.]|nr:BrnA antitoxin family protein [Rhizomicrobium sp.]